MSRRSDNPAAKVIVRNYPLTTPEKELRDMFEKIGKIDDCECTWLRAFITPPHVPNLIFRGRKKLLLLPAFQDPKAFCVCLLYYKYASSMPRLPSPPLPPCSSFHAAVQGHEKAPRIFLCAVSQRGGCS